MGWLQAIRKKWFSSSASASETVLLPQLPSWIAAQEKELLQRHNLESEAAAYRQSVQEKSRQLDHKVNEWQERSRSARNSELLSIFSNTKKLCGSFSIPDNASIETIQKVQEAIEPELEALQEKLEASSFRNNFSFILTEEEKGKITENPLLTEITAWQKLNSYFEQKLIQSGYRKLKTIQERAQKINFIYQEKERISQELQKKKEQHQLVEQKKKEKEQELLPLQTGTSYTLFNQISDQRSQLLTEMQSTTDIQKRFEFKQQLDQLEKTVGNKDFLIKIDEMHYRLDHFRQQAEKLQQELTQLDDDFREKEFSLERELELFRNLVRLGLLKEIEIKV